MSESLDRLTEVPELTADEILARVLHRDGLMLVIDKPAGLPVHRGPKGGANLESSFDALRFGLPKNGLKVPDAAVLLGSPTWRYSPLIDQ